MDSQSQLQQSRPRQNYSWTTTWLYPNGVTHTWELNAMFNCSCAAWPPRNPYISTLLTLCVDSPHRGPVMCKAFPCHYVIKDKFVSMGWRLCEDTILLRHTDDLVSHPYEIGTLWLCHSKSYVWDSNSPYAIQDQLVSPTYEIGVLLLI